MTDKLVRLTTSSTPGRTRTLKITESFAQGGFPCATVYDDRFNPVVASELNAGERSIVAAEMKQVWDEWSRR